MAKEDTNSHSKGGVGDSDALGLMEKYLHSQGAALHDKGRYDEAIDFFQRAVRLDDQSYTRYHLCLTHIEKKDFDKALREINRAIELNPSVAKYYHRRSRMWQSMGDRVRADEDYERAVALDLDYARVDQIRSTFETVERSFSGVEMIEWCATAQAKNKEIGSLLRDFEGSLKKLRETVESASCGLPCPAYCCHFDGETIRHGVHIGAWKLAAIRSFLKEGGLAESDFLGKMEFASEEHLVRLIPPHYVLKERERESVYYPKRGKKGLAKALLKYLPKGRAYEDLLWINEKSRACAFLYDRKCMIHDLGDEPSLPACREFLCMTGFVFVTLKHLDIFQDLPEAEEASQIRARSMARLNRLAVEALLILGRTLYGERLSRLRAAGYEALKAATRADTAEHSGDATRCIAEYRHVTDEYEKLFAMQRELAKREIKIVFGV